MIAILIGICASSAPLTLRQSNDGTANSVVEAVAKRKRELEPTMKRKADDDPSFVNNVKIIKTEKDATAADYSQDVKKKISASNRTGQACDRCRVRPAYIMLARRPL